MVTRRRAVLVGLLVAAACASRKPGPPPPDDQAPPDVAAAPRAQHAAARNGRLQTYSATAYSIEGETAGGRSAREGVVAADPDVLPIGPRIRVSGAGEYDGVDDVEDTAAAIRGRELDIHLAGDAEAKRFGRQVQVEVLERGDGARR